MFSGRVLSPGRTLSGTLGLSQLTTLLAGARARGSVAPSAFSRLQSLTLTPLVYREDETLSGCALYVELAAVWRGISGIESWLDKRRLFISKSKGSERNLFLLFVKELTLATDSR